MRRILIILAASLALAACAASDDWRGAAPPTSSLAPNNRTSVTIERLEDIPRASDETTREPTVAVRRRQPVVGIAEETLRRDAPAVAPTRAPRPRIRSITEEAPIADSSTARLRNGTRRFRPITE